MTVRSTVSTIVGLACAVSAVLTYRAFRRDLKCALKRSSMGSQVANTSCGPIEFASIGSGFPILIIHGAGGGFDQLHDFASDGRLTELGFQLIFVSRFGYLGTPLPSDASTVAQANLYAALLDVLGFRQAGVIAVSAGAPSGLEFCVSHPERCAALALIVPASYVPNQPAAAPNPGPFTEILLNSLLKSNFAFWLATKVARPMLIRKILATPVEVAEHASMDERRRLDKVLRGIMPVTKRCAGLQNDAAAMAQLGPVDLTCIQVPTLLISVEDDLYGTFRAARYLAQSIPNSKLVIYREGGHLWIGNNQELQIELRSFLYPLAQNSVTR